MKSSEYAHYQKLKEIRHLFELKDFNSAHASFLNVKQTLRQFVSDDLLTSCEKESNDMNYGYVIEILKNIQNVLREKMFDFRCSNVWAGMLHTSDESVRFCLDCKKHVYLVQTTTEYEIRAKAGQCVAIKSVPEKIYSSVDGGCLVTELEFDFSNDSLDIGLPTTRDKVPMEDSKIRQLQLFLEYQDYNRIKAENWLILYDSENVFLRLAYDQLQLGNYEQLTKHIDSYFYEKSKLDYKQELLSTIKNIRLKNRSNNYDDGFINTNSFCPACHQDPCMCSDPF